MAMQEAPKVSEVLPRLRVEIERTRRFIRPIGPRSRWGKKRAYALLLLEYYHEVVIILERILATLTRVSEIQKQVFHDASQDEGTKQVLIREQFERTSTLSVDVKSLYLWTAQITDILRKSGADLELDELQRISLFRHNFITHIHETPFFEASISTRGGTKFNPAKEEVEILFHPFQYSKTRFVGLKSIVKEAIPFIPELAAERNYWEQLYILYRKLNAISNQMVRRKAQKLIFRIGNATEPPGLIANMLLRSLIQFRRG